MPSIEVLTGRIPVNASSIDPVREVRSVSPLDIRFSQNVIYPYFSDGQSVDEAVECTHVVEVERESGLKELMLEAPFPPIEAILWQPKLRDGDGKPLLDAEGASRLGPEALFTLDNRRLYALQRAAISQLPQRPKASILVVTSSADKARHFKKFRTRTLGLSVIVTESNGIGRDNAKDFTAMRVWDWRSAVDHIEALAVVSSRTSDDRCEDIRCESGKACCAVAECAAAYAEVGSCGCWEYLDKKGIRRGPFSNAMMRQWWERRMLPPDLTIRAFDNDSFAGSNGVGDGSTAAFRLVADVFRDAPVPFAAGFSARPAMRGAEGQDDASGDARQLCAECGRWRWEGWTGGEHWYCVVCWRKWRTREGESFV